MSEPTLNSSVVASGLAKFTSQFTAANAPQLNALAASYLGECQSLENAIWGAITLRRVVNLVTYTLPQTNSIIDTVGALIGQQRIGMDDSDYVTAITIKIAVNRSFGSTTSWSNFANILVSKSGNPSVPVIYLESGNASFYFGTWDMILNPIIVASILAKAVPSGVGPNVFAYSTWADGNDFDFSSVSNTSVGEAGFGSVSDPSAGGLIVACQGM